MNIEKKLKRLGVKETKEFTKEEKNIVANNVTVSLIMAFPVLKTEQENILNKIQNANMFYAKIDENLPKINYIYENHKIYFDESVDINKLTDSMIHEIIHYIQDIRKKKDKLDKIGLCNFNELSLNGLGINEGAVQYISAKALNYNEQTVNKEGILLRTISPNYYPILTNLIEQIISLIGEDELVKAIIEEIKIQFPNLDKFGKIINEKHFNRILGLINPDKVVIGGNGNIETRKIEPTVMDNVTWDDAVMKEEIFGPILAILTYNNLDDLIKIISDQPSPLALYFFSRRKEDIRKVERSVSFGGGCINDTIIHLATSELGFGGVGNSGMGSYHGKKSFETFSHTRSIVKKATWIDLPMRYYPYNSMKDKLIRMFLK